MRRHGRRPARPVVVALVLAALVGCSGDGGSSTAPTTATTATPTTTSATTATTAPSPSTSSPSSGCRSGDGTAPAGAAIRAVPDVDGDGRPDRAWIGGVDAGTTTVGVATSAGGGATRRFDSASPVTRAILVVDTDRRPPVEILADDGRAVQLWAFEDCRIQAVLNPEGETYTFSLGFTGYGTGVGCVDVGGHQQLVGLNVVDQHGDQVDWSRTVVELDGLHARNGATSTGTYTRPNDDAAIALLHQVTCGDLTMVDDGITAPRR